MGKIINKFIATLPLIDNLCLSTYIVSRSLNFKIDKEQSCSIIIPCKNEKGNIETIVKKIPQFCSKIECIIPALEPSHALAYLIKKAPKMTKNSIVIMNMCGRGDKDIFIVAKKLKINI